MELIKSEPIREIDGTFEKVRNAKQVTEQILSYGQQARIDCAREPLRKLLSGMRSDSALRPNSEYLRGYVAGLQIALDLLGL
jgi:hypothetical protein